MKPPAIQVADVMRAYGREYVQLYGLVCPSVWCGPWVVHCRPVGKGQAALKYLATYIFRPAISNGRLLSLEAGAVRFRYLSSQTGRWTVCRLQALEFIRRYLQHVLPRGFVKVRYYGLYGHRHRGRLNSLREKLDRPAGDKPTSSGQVGAPSSEPPTAKPATCRHCGQPVLACGIIPRTRRLSVWPNAPPSTSCSNTDYQHPPRQNATPL